MHPFGESAARKEELSFREGTRLLARHRTTRYSTSGMLHPLTTCVYACQPLAASYARALQTTRIWWSIFWTIYASKSTIRGLSCQPETTPSRNRGTERWKVPPVDFSPKGPSRKTVSVFSLHVDNADRFICLTRSHAHAVDAVVNSCQYRSIYSIWRPAKRVQESSPIPFTGFRA